MIDTLIAGKLIQAPSLKTGKTGNSFTNFLLSVHVGEEKPVVVPGIAFADLTQKIAFKGNESLTNKGEKSNQIGDFLPQVESQLRPLIDGLKTDAERVKVWQWLVVLSLANGRTKLQAR